MHATKGIRHRHVRRAAGRPCGRRRIRVRYPWRIREPDHVRHQHASRQGGFRPRHRWPADPLLGVHRGRGRSGGFADPNTPPISPPFVLSSPLDGSSVAAPNVTVNQDTAGGPQNETAIAVDPNNPNRVVAAANDYATRAWTCTVNGTPCSAHGDGYSGTYFSNNGGATWCCNNSDPAHLGTLIPGVDHLAAGQYDAGCHPPLPFGSIGHFLSAALGSHRT